MLLGFFLGGSQWKPLLGPPFLLIQLEENRVLMPKREGKPSPSVYKPCHTILVINNKLLLNTALDPGYHVPPVTAQWTTMPGVLALQWLGGSPS